MRVGSMHVYLRFSIL